MTDCGCDKAKDELEEYIHHELASADAADIREHLAGCESCSEEALVGRVLTEVVQRACKEQAPEQLKVLVMERLRIEISARTVV